MLFDGAEAWTLSNTDAAALGVFERKVLRKIFGPVRVSDDQPGAVSALQRHGLVKRINTQRFRWLDYVVPPSV